MSAELPAIPLPLPHVPKKCSSCGEEAKAWPLGVFAGQLQLTCPACHLAVARLEAVKDGHQHYPIGAVNHDPFGHWPQAVHVCQDRAYGPCPRPECGADWR